MLRNREQFLASLRSVTSQHRERINGGSGQPDAPGLPTRAERLAAIQARVDALCVTGKTLTDPRIQRDGEAA